MKVEFKVRPVTRYVVTQYKEEHGAASSSVKGEYDNKDVAYEVAYALAKDAHEKLGYILGDDRIKYPSYPVS